VRRARANNVVTITPNDTVGAKSEGHVLGNPAAPVEIVEFADFECPVCAQWATVTEPDVRSRLIDQGKAKLRVYTFQVTSAHGNSIAAALAAECAADQGKFWEMHDLLLAHQDHLRKPDLLEYAERLGLDMARFQKELFSHAHLAHVGHDVESADISGVSGTPTFFINGRRQYGAFDEASLTSAVASARARSRIQPRPRKR
jgi:protein-disulfide isomerase